MELDLEHKAVQQALKFQYAAFFFLTAEVLRFQLVQDYQPGIEDFILETHLVGFKIAVYPASYFELFPAQRPG